MILNLFFSKVWWLYLITDTQFEQKLESNKQDPALILIYKLFIQESKLIFSMLRPLLHLENVLKKNGK